MLGSALLLFNFESSSNAKMVLSRDLRRYKEKVLLLDRWTLEVGRFRCFRKYEHAREVWVRVVELPLHLWCLEVFKKLGNNCGGFVEVNEHTAHLSH